MRKVAYRIFDVHEKASDAVAVGLMPFRPVVGDRIFVGDHVYTVEECRLRHHDDTCRIDSINVMCVRRTP